MKKEIIHLLPEGNNYKANLHNHTTLSDGCLSPGRIKEKYMKTGYSVVAFTDHRVFHHHKDLDDEGFLALAGYELDATTKTGEGRFRKTCHLNAIARVPGSVREIPQLVRYDHVHINQVIARLRDLGFIVNYNHPAWSAEESADYCRLEGITGFEVYNHGTEVSTLEGWTAHDYALWLKSGRQGWAVATDDNHNRFEQQGITDSCGGWVVFRAQALRYDKIIEAMDKGWFYASTGPEIHRLDLDGSILKIDCSPVRAVILKTPSIGEFPQNVYSAGDTITHAEFDISGAGRFARVELADTRGKMAFSNPVFLI